MLEKNSPVSGGKHGAKTYLRESSLTLETIIAAQ